MGLKRTELEILLEQVLIFGVRETMTHLAQRSIPNKGSLVSPQTRAPQHSKSLDKEDQKGPVPFVSIYGNAAHEFS